MATTLKLRRGTTAQHSSFTGAAGEVTVDTDKDVIVVHDGATAGGFPAIRAGGALGTPSSGTVTNLTGTASININGTVGATTPAAGTFTSLSDSGNLTFTGTGNRITGDFSNATIANRVAFQSSTLNSQTSVSVLPNGTSTSSSVLAFNNSDPTNSAYAGILNTGTEARLGSGIIGTGTYLPMTFFTGGSERMRVDTSGNVGIGTSSPSAKLQVVGNVMAGNGTAATPAYHFVGSSAIGMFTPDAGFSVAFSTASTERMRIDSSGNLLVGKTSASGSTAGAQLEPSGLTTFVRSGGVVLQINRLANDGNLVDFYQDTVLEGNISVSGTTVSYNGGHLSRWAQMLTKPDLLKGTVMSNLDEMNEYVDADGNPVPNEQLNKVKVSDIEGDANVAGVFVNWTHDEAHDVDEINMAMTGDMIIRIAQGTTVQRGDLLMSAGDGTAKPQGDDIVRSKTVAKVTSTHVTCTYADGSFCVPCVLMAC